MPGITARGDLFRDFDGLLGACEKNAELLPGVEPLKSELQTLYAEARNLKIEQENLEGTRKAVTQRLNKVFDDAKEATRKLRAFVLTRLGTRSEHLTQFGLVPNRRRPRRAKPAETPPPTDGNKPAAPATTTEGKPATTTESKPQ
ncbi:MAG TPA: hypothetical protein VGG03_25690 [Thermoanaerobaculia bacterium]|jgi:hypothetical protein